MKARRGQTVILAIFATAFLTLMVALVVNVGDAVAVKVQLQGAVDAAAYSGAMMQARALNVLTALNAYLDGVYYTYIGAAVSFGAALVVSAACKCPAPVDAWRSLVRPAIKAACAESGLKAVAKRQATIVDSFNHGLTSPVVVEARTVGRTNLKPIRAGGLPGTQFVRRWAVNFDTDQSRVHLPELHVAQRQATERFMVGAGDVICRIPAKWFLEPHFETRQYVLTVAVTKAQGVLAAPAFFGLRPHFYAVAQARPENPRQRGLELKVAEWQARLVPVEERVLGRLRQSMPGLWGAAMPPAMDQLIFH